MSKLSRYKFVELSVVTEETLDKTVNEWVADGWIFDGINFVVSDRSRRPQMAFVTFVRELTEAEAAAEAEEAEAAAETEEANRSTADE